jgi:hypothetical protein
VGKAYTRDKDGAKYVNAMGKVFPEKEAVNM